ncbi:hypothetical protein V6N12_030724 [Hibiscus sabdariffa]|uniref:Uncharacterized protein n=1 Tax=Hibiscus sabdariffa TaxID=183260 RepID=A0ABR2E8T9_9ROSI
MNTASLMVLIHLKFFLITVTLKVGKGRSPVQSGGVRLLVSFGKLMDAGAIPLNISTDIPCMYPTMATWFIEIYANS